MPRFYTQPLLVLQTDRIEQTNEKPQVRYANKVFYTTNLLHSDVMMTMGSWWEELDSNQTPVSTSM
jgi:hypothetical protein